MDYQIDQIIKDDGTFNAQIKNFVDMNAKQIKPDYIILGIIGAQSSGKSTLLNHLFGTRFQVMESKLQRKQTTKGIWMNVSHKYNMILLDIEGADSRERWEDKEAFEKRTALFGLVMTNLLIINVWLQDIGRFSASNYEILKLIFELNLQYFNKETPKKIVFVIRDFREQENLENISNTLKKDVQKLFSEIKKPKGLETLRLQDLFEIQVFTIRNFIYEKEKFVIDVKKFKQVLVDPKNPNYILKNFEYHNIPMDGLYIYMKQIWDTIENNKDINIPNQKIMVSSFRCNEIKNQSFGHSMKEIESLKQELKKNPNLNLKKEYDIIFNNSISFFKKNTVYYDEVIAESTSEELKHIMFEEYEKVFKEQNQKKMKALLQELKKSILKIYRLSNQNARSILDGIVMKKNQIRDQYHDYLDKNISEKKDQYFTNFDEKLTNQVISFLSTSTNSFFKRLIRNYVKIADNKIFDTFQKLTIESWEQFNEFLDNMIDKFKNEMQDLKNNYEDLRKIFTDETLRSFEKDMIFTIKNNIKNRKLYINEYLLERFRRKFEISSGGNRRNWRVMDDSEIEGQFKKVKQEFNPTMKALEESLVLNFDYEIIFNKEDCMKIKRKFEDEINDVLEQAFNKKYNRNSLQKVPKWLWVVLAYFMHDNVIEWLRNPLFFFLLILLSVTFGYLFATGKMHYVKFVYTFVKNYLMAKFLGLTQKPSTIQKEETKDDTQNQSEASLYK